MGFLDKAKRLAEQAQAKLDEAQQQLNTGKGQGRADGPAVEYDQHGRPLAPPPAESDPGPPHGDPLTGAASPPVAGSEAAGADPGPPHGDPLAQRAERVGAGPLEAKEPAAPRPAPGEADAAGARDRGRPSHDPPPLTGGDPLAG